MDRVSDQVIVITEASHGAGRALALKLSTSAKHLILGSSDSDALASVESECRQLGANVAARVIHMHSSSDVLALAHFAKERFGRIDAWINHLSSNERLAFPSDASPPGAGYELVCYENGAAAAIDYFSRQKRGLLINLEAFTGSVTAGAGALSTGGSKGSEVHDVFHLIEGRAAAVAGMRVKNVLLPRDQAGSARTVEIVVELLHEQRDMQSTHSFSERKRPGVVLETERSRGEGHWRIAHTESSWEGWSTAALIFGAIAVAVGGALFFAR